MGEDEIKKQDNKQYDEVHKHAIQHKKWYHGILALARIYFFGLNNTEQNIKKAIIIAVFKVLFVVFNLNYFYDFEELEFFFLLIMPSK